MGGSEQYGTSRAVGRRTGWLSSRLLLFCLACTGVTVLAGLVQMRYGPYPMTLWEVWQAISDPSIALDPSTWLAFLVTGETPEIDGAIRTIVWQIRLPRVIVGIVAGATLAVSGAIFQGVTRNELASPFVLGVSSGAGFAILATLVVFSGFAPYLPLIAALGGTVAFLVVYLIAWKGGTSPVRLVLAGVVVNMVFHSLQRGLFTVADDIGVVQSAMAWITGSLLGVTWEQVRLAVPVAIPAILIALAGARQLNVLALGSGTAKSLGMRVERVRFLLCGVGILTAAVAIAVTGIISFFGLVVPHVVRNVVGTDYRQIIVGCVFAGPALLVTADVGARQALAPMELPVGVVTGLVGGPYFLYLMRRRQSMGEL